MTTKILGCMTAPTTPQKCPATARKKRKVKSQAITQRLLGTILIAIGAITIPLENDATPFVMCLMLGIAAIIGDKENV